MILGLSYGKFEDTRHCFVNESAAFYFILTSDNDVN